MKIKLLQKFFRLVLSEKQREKLREYIGDKLPYWECELKCKENMAFMPYDYVKSKIQQKIEEGENDRRSSQ